MDVVLVGSGVSSTLLAESLVAAGCCRTLRIIGPERLLAAHRISYWSDRPTPFDAYADGEWSRFRVIDAAGRAVQLTLQELTYRTFPARAWHREARRRLRGAPGVELIDARVERVHTSTDRAVVHADARRFEADWVFSSVRTEGVRPALWQRFEGWEVALPEGAVELEAPVWMDFRTPGSHDFRFIYALPLGPTRLLLEHVSYEPAPHAEYIRAYLKDVLGVRTWERIDCEKGATPLYAPGAAASGGRVVPIGVGAGIAKTTTGYALNRMWRHAQRLARGLAEHGRPAPLSRPPPLGRLADRFFLGLVRSEPQGLRDFLMQLSAGVSGDALLRFLDDGANLPEQLEVARAAAGSLRWWLREARRWKPPSTRSGRDRKATFPLH